MRAFIPRYLEPADRLGEVLFGLIMALGITGAVRLGRAEADNRTLFTDIFGCNLAWAVVDAVMYVLGALFDRGRKARLLGRSANRCGGVLPTAPGHASTCVTHVYPHMPARSAEV